MFEQLVFFACRRHLTGKLLKYMGNAPGVDMDNLIPFWASCLPIREDEMEAHVRLSHSVTCFGLPCMFGTLSVTCFLDTLLQNMHAMLMELVEARNCHLLRPDNSGMVQVMKVLGEIVVGAAGGGGADSISMADEATMCVNVMNALLTESHTLYCRRHSANLVQCRLTCVSFSYGCSGRRLLPSSRVVPR